jgi:paraquat-inducible protein B
VAPDAPLQQDLRGAMTEISRAAQSFRALSDYLERHPESLIRGKKKDEP